MSADEIIHTFTDKAGREIHILDDVDIVATHDGKEVGKIQFTDVEFPGGCVTKVFHIEVEQEYQRVSIGTELVRAGVMVYGKDFGRPRFTDIGGSDQASSEYFTQEGAALFKHCIRLEIIDDIHAQYDKIRYEEEWNMR